MMPMVAKEKRHALRYKPAVPVRASFEWFEPSLVCREGAVTDFSLAGVAIEYADSCGPTALAERGRICLRLGYATEIFEVTLVRVVRKSAGHMLAGLTFSKRRDCHRRARAVIEHLKSAFRAGAVQARQTQTGAIAHVVGNLNFNVVMSLHRMLRGPEPPRLIDLDRCSGADLSGVEFLLSARVQGVDLKLDVGSRIFGLIQRHSSIPQLDPVS